MKFPVSTVAILLTTLVCVRAVPISTTELQDKVQAGLRLLSIEDGAAPVWKTEDEKLELMRAGIQFFDVTEVFDPDEDLSELKTQAVAITYPKPSHLEEVKAILETVSIPNMQEYLGNLTAFNNRYYTSTTGVDATNWIVKTVRDIAKQYTHVNATVAPFAHSWAQSSIIATIPGTSSGPVTILGAHMDSINLKSPTAGRAPGADDDGSGTVNLIEAFRALLDAGFAPSTPVEFHWYSGEEAGLLGSQAIAKSYKAKNVDVKAMLELDMTAYFRPGSTEVIALLPDYISEDLNIFLESLIDAYSALPWVISAKCGYACSDHASWYKQGYPSALPAETNFGDDDPAVHSAGDTTDVDGFSWTHTLEYAKIAVAFAYELAI